MKELSIKEKAKRYEEAIERAKAYKGLKSEMEIIFPELRESEDERMRRVLIGGLKSYIDMYLKWYDGVSTSEILAWYEKQGENEDKDTETKLSHAHFEGEIEGRDKVLSNPEKYGLQKIADKVEPRFKVGDWITNCATNPAQISSIKDGMYFTHNDTIGGDIESINKEYHFWTIQDAKDGDVLSYKGGQWIFIFKKNEKEHKIAYHALTSDRGFSVNDVAFTIFEDAIDPATKEQRDLLFQKMKDAGYEWHAEKKELKKIEQKPAEWIDDDEKRMNHIIQFLEDKDRWKDGERAFPIEEDVRWLKSIKDRVQPKQEWGEEDEKMIDNIIDYMMPMPIFFTSTKGKSGKEYTKEFIKEAIDWLKSIRPQNTWKPSDEQMKALNDVTVTGYISYAEQGQELINLYNDLKKLREEQLCFMW